MEGLVPVPRVDARDANGAAKALSKYGAVLLQGVWPSTTIDQVREIVATRHPEFADRATIADWFDNGEGRFISPIVINRALIECGLFDDNPLHDLMVEVLGSRYAIEAFGMMMAGAGCPAQSMHRDGGTLFPEAGVDALLPPTALTVAIPLVEVDDDNAPTAVYCGTHRFTDVEGRQPDIPPLKPGDMLVWDFRVLHHGCANRTEADRPLAYFTACRPFWIDHKNFLEGNRRLLAEADVIGTLGENYSRAVTP